MRRPWRPTPQQPMRTTAPAMRRPPRRGRMNSATPPTPQPATHRSRRSSGRAESLRSTQRDTSALLAAEAFRLADTPETRSALFSTFTAGDGFLDAHHLGDEVSPRGSQGIVMPDGVTAFYVDRDGRPRPYDLDTGALGDPLPVIVEPGDAILGAGVVGRWASARSGCEAWDFQRATDHARGVRRGNGSPTPRTDRALGMGVLHRVRRRRPIDRRDSGRTAETSPSSTRRREQQLASAPAGEVDPTVFYRNAVLLVGDDLVATSTGAGQLRILDPVTLAERRTIDIPVSTAGVVGNVGDGTIITAGDRGLNRVDLVTGGILWHHAAEASCDGLVVAARERTVLLRQPVRSPRGTRPRQRNRRTAARCPERECGAPLPRRWRSHTGQFPCQRAGGGTVETRRLGSDHPRHRSRVRSRTLRPDRPAHRRVPRRRRRLRDAGRRRRLGRDHRDLGQLSGQSWVDADTIGGVLPNAEGLLQTVEVDIDGGEATFLDLILDPPPVNAAIDSGKDVVLLQYGRA